MALVFGVGCGKPSMMMAVDAGPHYPSVAAANAVPDSSPLAEGQFRFLYDGWGTEAFGDWPPADFLVGLQTSEPDVFGNQFSKFGWIPDLKDTLPIGLKRGLVDTTQVRETCAACHVARLPDGTIWLGQPNMALNMEGFKVAVNERWVAAGHPSKMSDAARAKALLIGPGRTNAATSSYGAAVPARFPAYLQLSGRTRLNYLGTGRNLRSEAYLSIFSAGAGDPTTNLKLPFPPSEHVSAFLAFFGSMQPPTPPAQSAPAVSRGKAVFSEAKCDQCHHPDDASLDGVISVPVDGNVPESLPGENAAYPRGAVQTDPVHRSLIASNGPKPPPSEDGGTPDAGSGIDLGYLTLLEFIQDNSLEVGPTDGYRVGYLGGLWSRGPYLHNGSVPTLDDLLKPAAQRPATFMNNGFLVDTTLAGNSNRGHEFGVALSADDKTALIAYLNSL
jgi:mono/diheme cytochrome c family protein